MHMSQDCNHPSRLCYTLFEHAARHMAWQPDKEVMTQRMSLPPKTQLPWILHDRTPMPEGDIDSSDDYCEEIDTCHPLADLLEQFQQLKNHFANLKSTTPQSTPTEELLQLTDKLQHLTMALPKAPQSSEEPSAQTMQVYTDSLHATQRETNLTTNMLQDIPTFDGQDSSK